MSIIEDIDEYYLEETDKATERFEKREETINKVAKKIEKKASALDLDKKDRIEVRRKLIHPNDGLALERLIGESDLLPTNYLEQGLHAARSVGRVQVRDRSGRRKGFGTCFLIAPGLIMTNNHILRSEVDAMRSLIDFNYEDDVNFIPRVTATFPLEPMRLFLTNEKLDFTIVAVRQTAIDGTQLSQFNYLPLIAESGKALIGEAVSIIQHPEGQTKQIALRDSKIIDVDPSGPFIRYSTDTMPGSSGAPVFNDQWEVVALHRAGVKKRDEEGRIINKEGRLWKPEQGIEAICWIANEGVRISRIMDALENSKETTSALEHMVDRSHITAPTVLRDDTSDRLVPEEDEDAEWEVGELEDYDGVMGYDAHFLDVPVPLPKTSAAVEADLAPLKDGKGHELRYTNFSVVMSKSRRQAFYAVCNIDGKNLKSAKRPRKWRLDPRMDFDYQAGNELYKRNPLDRGHLVRRLDPMWGPDFQQANRDTFHYTNAAPQHAGLNQKTWLKMEDYILGNARNKDKKVTVFTGPVFRPDDIVYRREFKIPAEYWKVVAVQTGRGEIRAVGYLQTQKNLIGDLEMAFGDSYRTYSVPITTIEALTGFDFGELRDFDPLADIESTAGREISGPDDIVL